MRVSLLTFDISFDTGIQGAKGISNPDGEDVQQVRPEGKRESGSGSGNDETNAG